MLRVNEHLLSVGRSRLQLRLSLPVVHGAIGRAVSRSLAEAIDRGGEGVERGIFRGPTLHVTNRWIYVEPLLAGTIGIQLAAFTLARKVESALRASAQAKAPTAIFQVKSAPRLLARHLSECLSLTGRYYPQPSELNIGEPPIGEEVPVSAKVVLCADTIRTEDTVRQAVAIVAGRNADPLVIACVVDARDTHGPVRVLDRDDPGGLPHRSEGRLQRIKRPARHRHRPFDAQARAACPAGACSRSPGGPAHLVRRRPGRAASRSYR